MSRYDLTDFEWSAIEPVLPRKSRGVRRVDDRRVLNGIFRVLRSGAPWADLPGRYGPPTTCYNRFRRWTKAGVWDRIMDAVTAAHDTTAAQDLLTGLARGATDPRWAYDAAWLRRQIEQQGAVPNIPNRAGKKWQSCFSKTLYMHRNLVECFFNKIRFFRRVANRYDKLGSTCLAMVKLAAIRIWLRFNESTA